jgi:hypothetical protein
MIPSSTLAFIHILEIPVFMTGMELGICIQFIRYPKDRMCDLVFVRGKRFTLKSISPRRLRVTTGAIVDKNTVTASGDCNAAGEMMLDKKGQHEHCLLLYTHGSASLNSPQSSNPT